MGTRPNIAESFPLKVGDIFRCYTKIPYNDSAVFYHYTTHVGLEGILRSGGLRATYRMRMNDAKEFDYARNVIYEALNEVGERQNLTPVVQSLTTYTRKNLDQFLKDTIEMSSAYCACLTANHDHPKQWKTYAEDGKGFAIGFDLVKFLNNQVSAVQRRKPYIFCAPVTYNETDQYDLVWRLVETGVRDLQTFADTCSQQPEDITTLRDRVTKEIVVHLLVLINFLKAPTYSSEREMRLFLDQNNDTLEAPNIQRYERCNESIPFIFMDLCSPITKRLPLVEIMVGPKASFAKKKGFLEGLLDKLGYGRNYGDRPRITQSLVAMGDCL